MILTALAEKGRTDKTMVATNMAGMRASRGRRVLLIDADRQGSSEHWAQLRSADRLPHVECVPLYGAALRRYLQTRVSHYDDVVIDVGTGDSDEMTFALAASDCADVPVRPTAADVWTMTLMDSRIAEAIPGNPGLRAFELINLASTNPRQPAAEETRRVLEQGCSAMEVSGPTLCDRVAFQRAVRGGAHRRGVRHSSGEGGRRTCRTVRGRVRGSAHARRYRAGGLMGIHPKRQER